MTAIAPLLASDQARWMQLWSEYQVFYKVALSAAVTEATWTRLHDARIRGLGARDASGRLVGFVHFLFHEDTWSTVPACYLQDLYVDAAARGGGVARRLIEAVADCAQSAGCNPPYWLTHETNDTARRLYDKLAQHQGFIHYVYRS